MGTPVTSPIAQTFRIDVAQRSSMAMKGLRAALRKCASEAVGQSGRAGARVYRVSAFLGLVTNEPRKAEGCFQWSFMDAFAMPARLRA